ncbi:MAG: hypothetical protein GX432_02675 [Candidatus Atribacteria bacterium]|nr:hypothetical protein [Candidatus Atribacteria bacterium]
MKLIFIIYRIVELWNRNEWYSQGEVVITIATSDKFNPRHLLPLNSRAVK